MKNIISIGINNAKGLPPLQSAVSGAEQFAAWGNSQGYTVDLFIDALQRVSQTAIFDRINEIIEERTCEQLIIFFAGHGILKSPSQEIWLLSNAQLNPNESINLTGSIDIARTSGIPYIVFISDACRVLPNEMQFTGNGSVIFPILDDTNQDCAIDILYATRPGNPALEQTGQSNSERFGLFTQALLEVLNGNYPELIKSKQTNESLVNYYNVQELTTNKEYKKLPKGKWSIDSFSSEAHIKSLVAKKASDIKITLKQNPEIRLEYQNPKPSIAEFDDNTAKNILLTYSQTNTENVAPAQAELANKILGNLRGKLTRDSLRNDSFKDIINKLEVPSEYIIDETLYERHVPTDDLYENIDRPDFSDIKPIGNKDLPDPQAKFDTKFLRRLETIYKSKGRDSFETQTGFTIIGTEIQTALSNSPLEIFKDYENTTHIRIHPQDQSKTALIILQNGNSIPIAILDGYIGTLVFEKETLLTINYSPSQNSYKYHSYLKNEKRIGIARSYVASAANDGFDYIKTFKDDFNKDGQINFSNAGSYLRQDKDIDPSLGLYAVYAFRQEGKIKDIKSVYRFMAIQKNNILFDIAMLASALTDEKNRLAPFCPMLSLGWAYRHQFESLLDPIIIEASNYLVPSLWTTFTPRGTQLIKKLFT